MRISDWSSDVCSSDLPSVLKPGIASRPPRMTQAQSNILASIANVVGSAGAAFEVLRQARVLHLTITDIEQELARRRLAGEPASTPALLPVLRDMVGGDERKRGLFKTGPLRRRFKIEHGLFVGEPHEWGLSSYRSTLRQLADRKRT